MNQPPKPPLTWDVDIPLLTNGYMLTSLLKVTVGAGLVAGALVSLLLAVQGNARLAAQMLAVFVAAGFGFFGVSVLVMGLLFGNRLGARFTVSASGIDFESRDRLGRAAGRGALMLGLLLGRPAAAGSGLLAMTQETRSLAWSGAFRVEADRRHHRLAFKNRWRILLMVYGTPGNYPALCDLVAHHMRLNGTAERCTGKSPLGPYLWRTLAAVLACLPVLLLADVFGYGLLLPLLLLCFAIASVWFVRHLAWVVLFTLPAVVAAMLADGLSLRESSFAKGQVFRRYEVLSGDHWALTALAGVGAAYLLWLAIQTLRARIHPALEADLADAGEP